MPAQLGSGHGARASVPVRNDHGDATGRRRIGHTVVVHSIEVSEREAEVLAAVGARLSNAQIANRLHISVRTVESHVSSLLRKYGVTDRWALTEQAQYGSPPPGQLVGLPASRTTFVGRSRERDLVLGLLADVRLVTLLGPGGIGKTRLAAVVAEAAGRSFPLGGAFVDLVPVRDGFIAQAVAAALGVTERPGQALEDSIAQRLGRGRSLLVLDNCEHLLDVVAGFVERLLSTCPDVTMLVTSRERTGVPGERIVPVEPLPLASDAERLFRDRATAAAPGFSAGQDVVAELCGRLDGMPLAIELAAARCASLGADGLLAALDDGLRLLSGGRGPVERHRSLDALIGWSHTLLADNERDLFRRLSIFVGGFDLTAVAAVAPSATRGAVADVLGRLVDKSLVVHQGGTRSRWRLLETVRAFAAEQLEASGERAEIQQRHLRWAAAASTELESLLDGEWRGDFDAVADDLRSALAAAAPGRAALSHRLARSLGHLAYARRFLHEAPGHYEEAARRALVRRRPHGTCAVPPTARTHSSTQADPSTCCSPPLSSRERPMTATPRRLPSHSRSPRPSGTRPGSPWRYPTSVCATCSIEPAPWVTIRTCSWPPISPRRTRGTPRGSRSLPSPPWWKPPRPPHARPAIRC